jgi:hypothetical protein
MSEAAGQSPLAGPAGRIGSTAPVPTPVTTGSGNPGRRSASSQGGTIRYRTLLLPPEHGSWAFLLEPIALGLLLAPSAGGAAVAAAYIAFFLARQPLRLHLLERLHGRYSARRRAGAIAAAVFCILGVAASVVVLQQIDQPWQLAPLLVAIPFALAQIAFDVTGRSRQMFAELAGALAISSSAALIIAIAGHPLHLALLVWLLIAARIVPSILYVRYRLRRRKGQASTPSATIISHLVPFAVVPVAVSAGASPIAAVPYILLMGRAIAGMVSRADGSAKRIGIAEIAWGVVTVVLLVVAMRVAL